MTVRKALSAFLALTILISSSLFSFPLGISAEGENRVTAQTDAAVTQGDYRYCYVYIDDASMLASLSVSVYYDTEKIEAADSYNQIACSFYDSSNADGCIQYTYLFSGEGSPSKTALFYFRYRVKDDAAIGDTFFDIVINEAYDSALNILPVSGSRTNFTVKEKKQVLNCYVYGTSHVYSSINSEFTVTYSLSTNQIAAGSVLIQYDRELFEVTEVTAGDLLDNKRVDVNSNLIGAVFVSFSGTNYSLSTQFLNIKFKAIQNTDKQSAIKMTVIELYDLERNRIIGSSTETVVSLTLDPSYKGDAPSMSVSTQYIEPGTVIATIELEKDSHLGAGDFVLNFDPSVLEYVSFYKVLSPDYFIINEKNVEAGELKFSIISLTDITEASNVLAVMFNVKHACKGATTALEISGSQLSDSMTNPIVLDFRRADAVIPPTDTYGDWKVDVAPQCESVGYESRSCTICNNTEIREIPALKHELTKVPAKPATCTEIGWNEYEKCSRCEYTTYVELPSLKHELTKVPAKPATCTEIGWNEYEKCSRCEYTTYVELPALKHGISKVPAKPATCTEIGWNEYEKCSRCEYTTYVEIPMVQHKYTSVIIKPQLGVQGYTLHTCSVCGDSFKDNYTDALTYIYGDTNGDGIIDGCDVLLLRKYMANYDYDTETSTVEVHAGADANGDGTINGRDVLLLRKYMVNYDYDTGSSSVVLGPR